MPRNKLQSARPTAWMTGSDMAKRTDRNQADIVRDLRALGYSAYPTHELGRGFPDIAVGFRGRNFLFEIKDPDQPPSKRRLTDDEQEWHESWQGQVDVIHSADEAVRVIEAEESARRGA